MKPNTNVNKLIDSLRDKKAYSYNDMVKRFKSIQHRINIPPLVEARFLEHFNNDLIITYAKNEQQKRKHGKEEYHKGQP